MLAVAEMSIVAEVVLGVVVERDGGTGDGGVAAGEEDHVQLAVAVDDVFTVLHCCFLIF